MAPHSSTLSGKSHGWRSLVGYSPWGHEESDTTEQLRFHFSLSCTGEGNGNPPQCSCLDNPRDRGAWWAAVYGVAQSQTRLKRLSSSNVINDNPSWHLTDSPAVNGATGHSRSLDTRKVIPVSTVKQTLRETDNEFELRYQQTFSDLTSQLHITPGTAYQSSEQVMYELLWDGINWGHIMAFFPFSGTLCIESIDKEMQILVNQITTWMATYLNGYLEPWIQEGCSWDTFVKLYKNNTATESQRGLERFNHCPRRA